MRQQFGYTDKMASATASVASSRFESTALPGMTEIETGASFHNWFLFKTIDAIMDKAITTMPEHRVPRGFRLGTSYGSMAGGKSRIPDAPNIMRTVDFAMDVERKAEEKSEKFKKLADGFRGALSKIHEFIGGILNDDAKQGA
jgi:hypothetical protein